MRISVKEFRDQEGWRKMLAETFAHHQGVLATAIDALRRGATIYGDAPRKEGVHPDASTVHEFHRIKGWNQALKALEEMCNPMPETSSTDRLLAREPWSDYASAESELLKNAPPKPETFFQPPQL